MSGHFQLLLLLSKTLYFILYSLMAGTYSTLFRCYEGCYIATWEFSAEYFGALDKRKRVEAKMSMHFFTFQHFTVPLLLTCQQTVPVAHGATDVLCTQSTFLLLTSSEERRSADECDPKRGQNIHNHHEWFFHFSLHVMLPKWCKSKSMKVSCTYEIAGFVCCTWRMGPPLPPYLPQEHKLSEHLTFWITSSVRSVTMEEDTFIH